MFNGRTRTRTTYNLFEETSRLLLHLTTLKPNIHIPFRDMNLIPQLSLADNQVVKLEEQRTPI